MRAHGTAAILAGAAAPEPRAAPRARGSRPRPVARGAVVHAAAGQRRPPCARGEQRTAAARRPVAPLLLGSLALAPRAAGALRSTARRGGASGASRVARGAAKARARGGAAIREAPPQVPLGVTLRDAFAAGVEALSGDGSSAQEGGALTWTLDAEEEVGFGGALYERYRIEGVPSGQGQAVGNTLRRALLRHDLFRSPAAVAVRVRQTPFSVGEDGRTPVFGPTEEAKHEFASLPGVHESMLDVVRNLQQMAIAASDLEPEPLAETGLIASAAAERGDRPESWRWSARMCGPCSIQARDLHIVDSSAHFERPLRLVEPTHHICRVTASSMLEVEVEAVCCSQAEWQGNPICQDHERSLRHEGWLIVPALFSPVIKVNYRITGAAAETVELEVWTRPGTRPAVPVRAAAAALLAGLAGRPQDPSPAAAPPAPAAASLAPEGPLGDGDEPGGDALDEMITSVSQKTAAELVDEEMADIDALAKPRRPR